MLDWWKTLTEDSQIKLLIGLIPVILALLAGLGYLLKKLFEKKQSSTAQSLTISGDLNIGPTLADFTQELKRRETEIKAELNQAHHEDRQVLTTERQAIQQQLQNSTTSYEARIASLKERITHLETLCVQLLPDDILDQAKTALEKGDSQNAYQLFKQIEDQADSVIKVAEAAYQRSQIAKDAIRYREAFTHSQKAVRLVPDNAVYLNGAGQLAEILGAYQQAIGYYEQALASDLKIDGEDHPDVATIRNNLGSAWDSLGDYQKAIGYFEQALASDLKTYSEEHPKVAIRRNNFGHAWKALGESKKAIGYYEQALASDLKTYGEDHPAVATIRNNLGLAWKAQGESKKAIGYYEQALASDLKTYGEDHPAVATIRNNLGLAWESLGKYHKAIGYYEQALTTLKNKFKVVVSGESNSLRTCAAVKIGVSTRS